MCLEIPTQRERANVKARTKIENDIPSIMMFAAVKSSGSQNPGWTHLSPLWSNSRANVASGAATEVLVILMHKVSEDVLRDPHTTRTSNVKARTKTEDETPSIMMLAAVKSSGSQNLG